MATLIFFMAKFKISKNHEFDGLRITKDWIESRLNQETLMQFYLGVPLDFDNLICSPIRDDPNPTCSLYKKSGNVYMKDFSGHFHGDVYNLVCFQNHLDYGDLMGAMKIIVSDFPDTFGISGAEKEFVHNLVVQQEAEEKKQKLFQYAAQKWQPTDKTYWKSYHLTSLILAEFGVHSASHIWVDGKLRGSYFHKDPIYAYDYGRGRIKFYFPLRKGKSRFMCNTDAIQGWNQLPEKGHLVIITKSLKDVMVLKTLGYSAIAPQSEHHSIPPRLIEVLKTRFKNILIMYDNDNAGRRGAEKACDTFPILSYIEIPEIYEGCKDISDVVQTYGVDVAKDVMEELTQWI